MGDRETAVRLSLPKIDLADPTPRYVQAQRILAEAIREGRLRAGSKLPSTKDIGSMVNVSLITAHKALERLVEAGLIRREVGRGTYVCEDAQDAVESQRQASIGLILDPQVNINDYYHSTIIDALRRVARSDAQRIEFFFHDRLTLRNTRRGLPAGLVCIHPSLSDQAQVVKLAREAPVVVLGGTIPGDKVACVDCDNYAGARDAVRHLCALGHRRFMVLSGPMDLSNSRDRAEGAFDELAAQGLVLEERDSLISGDSVTLDEQAGILIQRRLQEPHGPTAIVAGGFYLALSALQAVRRAGFCVPQDVSVVGFDDPPSAPLLDPPLTTVRQPLTEMAAKAFEALRQAMHNGSAGVKSCNLPTELVLRGSCDHPRSE